MRPVAVTSLLVLIVVGCETARPGGVMSLSGLAAP